MSPRKIASVIFHPILAGASLNDRLFAGLGALIGIALTGLLAGLITGHGLSPLLVAPMGASAVLVFAVPASPLAQPWSVIGGNTLSAAVGLFVAHVVPEPVLATGLAVSLAIVVMSLARCLHPPGGAAALMAVLGGGAVDAWGPLFPLVPVLLNAAVLTVAGIVFHRLRGRSYPHRPAPAVTAPNVPVPPAIANFEDEDVDAALAHLDESFDIDREDLIRLMRQVEAEHIARRLAQA
jgi:CBS-domain-containing membrane protein